MVGMLKNHIKEGVITRIETITNSTTKRVAIIRVMNRDGISLKRSTNLDTTTSDSKKVSNSLTKREEISKVMSGDRTSPNRKINRGTRTLDRIIVAGRTHNKMTQVDTAECLTHNIKRTGKMICDTILIVDCRELCQISQS